MSRADYLFSKTDWFSVEAYRRRSIIAEIDQIDGNRLLNTSIQDLCNYFEQQYRVDVPVLDEDGIVADQHEAQIDVSGAPYRNVRDRSRPVHVAGTAIEVTVPFTGDAEAFEIQPTSYTTAPPRGLVGDGVLLLTVRGIDLDAAEVRSQVDRTLAEIRKYLGWLRTNVDAWNKSIRKLAGERIEWRRQKLLADQNLVAALGFPLRQRADAPLTYTAPEVRRRITPTMPRAGTTPYQPEPALDMDDYEHIVSVMTNMALVMERSPSAFVAMNEEALRSHFLVQLNGHYEGQAAGETFNYEGKTDILIRVQGKNIFIAECKYWDGAKKLFETIDQILGYASWRDTKIAIVIFNRNRNFSQVLEGIPVVMAQHPNFKRELDKPSETSFRYVFAHRDDPNREMMLTVLAFDVPRAAPG